MHKKLLKITIIIICMFINIGIAHAEQSSSPYQIIGIWNSVFKTKGVSRMQSYTLVFSHNKYLLVGQIPVGKFIFLKKISDKTFSFLLYKSKETRLNKRYGNIFRNNYNSQKNVYVFYATFYNQNGNIKMKLRTGKNNQYWADCNFTYRENIRKDYKNWLVFLKFLNKFTKDNNFQTSRTMFPIKYEEEFGKKGEFKKNKWGIFNFGELKGDFEFRYKSNKKIVVICNFGDPYGTHLTFEKLNNKWFFTYVFFEAGGH